MLVGSNAVRNKIFIKSTGLDGTLVYGPYKLLNYGKYILNIEIFKNSKFIKERNFLNDYVNIKEDSINKTPSIKIEIVFDEEISYTQEINISREDFIAEIPFEINNINFLKKIQFRIMNFGFKGSLGSFKITRVYL